MRTTNSLTSNKVLDGHVHIDVTRPTVTATCNSSQILVSESNNATIDTVQNSYVIYTCLRAYGSGVLLALSAVGSMIGFIVPELLAGPIWCYSLTLMLMLASFSFILSFLDSSKLFCPIAFQDITETNFGLGWFIFGVISTEQYLHWYYLGRKKFFCYALQGLLLWYLSREHVDNAEYTDTLDTQIV